MPKRISGARNVFLNTLLVADPPDGTPTLGNLVTNHVILIQSSMKYHFCLIFCLSPHNLGLVAALGTYLLTTPVFVDQPLGFQKFANNHK